ncbi:three-helix bundle dimerization domain-containing protein [Streptomyces sp. NPDC056341]|uniref:three-helix bundle dimerization domain-containing protein n=1 Tax=Streptomyces sp. NPDC056341 TaxID=3345788 RepID=UPI0035DE7737
MARESTEAVALRQVAEGLSIADQGRCSSEQVDAAVSAVEHFKDSRVRAFVPVLAEHRARSILDSATVREAGDRADMCQSPGITPHSPAQSPSAPHDDAASRSRSSSRASVPSGPLAALLPGIGTRLARNRGR